MIEARPILAALCMKAEHGRSGGLTQGQVFRDWISSGLMVECIELFGTDDSRTRRQSAKPHWGLKHV
jgi:hypothetical protein